MRNKTIRMSIASVAGAAALATSVACGPQNHPSQNYRFECPAIEENLPRGFTQEQWKAHCEESLRIDANTAIGQYRTLMYRSLKDMPSYDELYSQIAGDDATITKIELQNWRENNL